MKKHLIFTLALFAYLLSFSQEEEDPINKYYSLNTFYLEGLGKAGNVSLNFERRRMLSDSRAISFQLGAGPDINRLIVPISFNYMQGKGPHYWVGGLGRSLVFNAEINNGKFIYHKLKHSWDDSYWYLQLGYRFQKAIGGPFFQFLYTPLFDGDDLKGVKLLGINHWLGISFGYSLKNANVR